MTPLVKSLFLGCFCILLTLNCNGQRFSKKREALKIIALSTKGNLAVFASYPYPSLPKEIQNKVSIEEYHGALDSTSSISKLIELESLNLHVESFQFIEVSKLFKGKNIKYRFSGTKTKYNISSENTTAYYNIIGLVSAEGSEIIKTKNGATIIQNQEFFSLFNPSNDEWFHFELKTETLLTIFGRSITKEIFQRYYKSFFKKSDSPWDKESINSFEEVYEEIRNSEKFSKVNFDDFCSCRIRELEKIPEEVFLSDVFWESERSIELSRRCLILTEKDDNTIVIEPKS